MGEIGVARADAVAGWVEDVPVALPDRDREFLFGTGLQLADPGLPMLGGVDEALRLLQRPCGQTSNGLAPHFLLAARVRERQIVAQGPQGRTFRTLAGMDAVDRLGDPLDSGAGRNAVIGQHDQLGSPVAHLVRHIERPARESDRLEHRSSEYLPYPVVELEDMLSVCAAGAVYVSAFPDFGEFRKHMKAVAWETEVWLRDAPDRVIHYDGDRFLGPRIST